MEGVRKALGEDLPEYAHDLNNLAKLFVTTGRTSEALAPMVQVAAIDDRMIGQIFAIASERQRMASLTQAEDNLNTLLSLVSQYLGGCPEAVHAALGVVLRRKAIGAEALVEQRGAVLGGKYPALEAGLRELDTLRMRIAQRTLAGPGPEGLPFHQQQLAQWNFQRERLEADLARQIPEMNLERKLRAADRRAVALGLPEGVALVEFIRFHVRDFHAVPARGKPQWKPWRYLAFVLPAGAVDDVRMIDLGEADPIDRLIADFRAGIIGEGEDRTGRDVVRRRAEPAPAAGNAGLALRAAIFDPLVPALGDRMRLLVAPDGDLTRLPFETLPQDNGRRLIDDWAISYLSCARDVIRFGTASTGQPTAPLVVADPDFDLDAEGGPHTTTVSGNSNPSRPRARFWSRLFGHGRTASIKEPRLTSPPAPVLQPPGHHSRDLGRSRFHFDRLWGTRVEAERIAAQLEVKPCLGVDALEGRLKTACRSPRILHLATHGFFLPNQERDPGWEGLNSGLLGDLVDRWGRLSGPLPEDPLLRSGLALAGANTWLRDGHLPAEAEDGLLTAVDVSSLDLLGTELVVLSACDTGLGEVHVGEGVFGLRRSFVLAGAKTLVMSLWKVSDETTQELMEDFYRRILAGRPRAEALREAQLSMKAKHPDPYCWGAFICQGDPGPLDSSPASRSGP
jgi:CHAT domain-containing protein